MTPLPISFYLRDDVLLIAKELIGKVIETNINGQRTSGMIIETEAYAGIDDKASHAYGGRRTRRNEAMFGTGGNAYVYLCYGLHHLFNVVTNKNDVPHAVLIRGVLPFQGIAIMEDRRRLKATHPRFSTGPGTLTQALGIGMQHNMIGLQENELTIRDCNFIIAEDEIKTTPRIGVDYAGEDALLPYRFLLHGSSIDRLRGALSGLDENR